jgi:hypothetical protein
VCNGLRAVFSVEETTMILGFRVASVTMVLVLLLGGPLAPLAAAQQSTQQSDTFKEMMKQPDFYEKKPEEKADVVLGDQFYDVAAGVMTAFLVPGRAFTCFVGGALATVVLVLTLGSGYRAAGGVVQEGCGGKWIVRGEDLAQDRPAMVNPSMEKK